MTFVVFGARGNFSSLIELNYTRCKMCVQLEVNDVKGHNPIVILYIMQSLLCLKAVFHLIVIGLQ